eukprot:CAMPEP_0173390534 /NCGR_PEP_ID=MMETSP1356-20130122/15216_1 /TAXON_ID=77927 ORGANISM="Hemiselmis virescens, Strain PCC157" /NCGR_SAMPLE_ID=MMETSP1356 /ASSEMBLY_ACC=CAM_ASM_000847 /LENGTH=127 /DNA_ID=CAMNT_0014347953 /DNA_START=25 /DNA_END=404 /DNA_ORIENTATION=-
MALSEYCLNHAWCDPQQHLYKTDPATGLSMLRHGSAALSRLHKEAQSLQRTGPASLDIPHQTLSLNTALSPGEKLKTPDRLLVEALSSVAERRPKDEDPTNEDLVRVMTKIQSKRAELLKGSVVAAA